MTSQAVRHQVQGPSVTPTRLRTSADISATMRSRRRRVGDLGVVHVRDAVQRADQPARVAVVASRKVGNAVRRNRAKRLLREAARHIAWAPGLDVVLVARAATTEARAAAVADEITASAAALDAVDASHPAGVGA